MIVIAVVVMNMIVPMIVLKIVTVFVVMVKSVDVIVIVDLHTRPAQSPNEQRQPQYDQQQTGCGLKPRIKLVGHDIARGKQGKHPQREDASGMRDGRRQAQE
jgi:hypothetical protein